MELIIETNCEVIFKINGKFMDTIKLAIITEPAFLKIKIKKLLVKNFSFFFC